MQHVRKLSGLSMSNLGVTQLTDLSHKEKLYCGYLFKRKSKGKKFQKRYFVLYEGKLLVYYASEVAKQHISEINLCEVLSIGASQEINVKCVYRHAFEMKLKKRTYILSAPDTLSMNEWIQHIKRSVFGTKIHEGWLTKKGEFVKSWKRRYFVLADTKLLRYFEDEAQTKIKGIINVQQIQFIKEGAAVEPHWNFMIELRTDNRLWFLNADSEEKRQQWMRMLDEGKKVINYDASASLFVDINRDNDAKKDIMFCQTTERIKYILQLYQKWCKSNQQFAIESEEKEKEKSSTVSTGFKAAGSNKLKGIFEILNSDLRDYSNVELLNDLHFLVSNYGSHLQRNKFTEFYHFILGKDVEKAAVLPWQSLILLRNLRNRAYYSQNNGERRMLYNDSEDIKEINTQILLDSFYSYVIYNYETLILDPVEWSRIKDYEESDKFNTANVMLAAKKQWIKKVDRKICNLDDRAHKFNMDPNHNVSLISNDAHAYLKFGAQDFVYWDDCKNNEWFIDKQYANLKQEMVSNTLCVVSMQQWNNCMESASNMSQSTKASEYISYDAYDESSTANMVDKYGIYEFTPMKLSHICSIILYSNYYQLQQALIQTIIQLQNESIEEWKLRHTQFAIWSRCLVECCQVFGKKVTEKDVFYSTINTDDIDFAQTLNVSYLFPTSMTQNIFVAQSYFAFEDNNDNNGMILSISGDNNAFYMDLGWCSEFANEEEVLLLCVYPQKSQISSMVHISYDAVRNEAVFNNYQYYMRAMDDLQAMICAKNASHFIHNKQTKLALEDMIQYRLRYNNRINDQHIESMFDVFCDSVRVVCISFAKMVSVANGYRAWKEIFMSEEQTWCKMDLLVQLFPNLNIIEMKYTTNTFSRESVKKLVIWLKSDCVKGKELNIKIFKPQAISLPHEYKENLDHEENVQSYSLQNALKKYLLKKSKTGSNFCWISRLNQDKEQTYFIEISRPNNAIGRNAQLSLILNEHQVNLVMDVLKKELSKDHNLSSNKWYLDLLFSSIKHGFNADDFHKICDGFGPTLSVIKSSTDHIFCAYTSKTWGNTGKWVMDKYAFLIQIQKDDNQVKVINIKAGHEQYGMYLQSHGGPGFGKGDIKILNKANKTNRNTCHSNSFVFNCKKPNDLVGGSGSYFKVDNYEVFQIAFY